MSYCRKNGEDSDVYVILTREGDGLLRFGWECLGCQLAPVEESIIPGVKIPGCTFLLTRQDMIAHLEEHRASGDKVPERAFERLRREIAEEAQE